MPPGFWLTMLVLSSAVTTLGLIVGAVWLIEWVARLPAVAV